MSANTALNTTRFYFNASGTTTDDQLPILQVRYIGADSTHTILIQPTGGTSSKLKVTLTDITTGASAFDGGGATYTTLQALVDGINAVAGWEARRSHGPADYPLGTDDFIALSATAVPRTWYSCLYRDSSEIEGVDPGGYTCRIGYPDFGRFIPEGGGAGKVFGGNKGRIEICGITGFITGATTAPYLVISQDAGSTAASEVKLVTFTESAHDDSTPQSFLSRDPGNGLVFQGPLLLEARSVTASNPTVVDLQINWRPVD
jgi:hypothetical protein